MIANMDRTIAIIVTGLRAILFILIKGEQYEPKKIY